MGLVGIVFEIVVLAACAAAVITNAMLIAACDFMTVTNLGRRGTFGLFSYQGFGNNSGECTEIPEDYGDGWFTTAQICSIIAFCSGAILFGFGFFKQCLCPLPCTQLIMDLSATLTQVCLALVYLVWFSAICDDFECSYGDSATLLILTQVFWLAAGCFSRCMRPGRSERRKADGDGN